MNTLIIAVIVVGALYFARDVFVPLALALLLSFALGPLVMMLRGWRFGRVPSVVAAVVLASLIIFGIGGLIGSQLAVLAENLPQYRYNMVEKIQSLRSGAVGSGILGPVSKMLEDLKKEISRPAETPPAPDRLGGPLSQPNQQKPVPVEIHQPSETPAEVIQAVAGPLLPPLAMTGIVVVFVIFFLLQREDLRDRFIRLAGARDLNRTTRALDEAASRLSRYLLTQCAINACFGVLIGFGLWLIGVQSPLLWGLLAMLLRFVPISAPLSPRAFPPRWPSPSTPDGPHCSGPSACSCSSSPSWARSSSHGSMGIAPACPQSRWSSPRPSGHGSGGRSGFWFPPP